MAQLKKEDYLISNIDQLDSPALVIYPDKVKANIRIMVEMAGGNTSSLRPHVKTHKSPDATRLLLEEAELVAEALGEAEPPPFRPQVPRVLRATQERLQKPSARQPRQGRLFG